jgi:hypothetical protein
MEWTFLDPPDDPLLAGAAMRLNALGSLYYFSKFVLGRDRLSENLHLPISRQLEAEHLHLVLEIPRDHLKTSLVTESLSMWWALPFGERDEIQMRELGYDDAWIRWMKRAHDPNTRTLIVSEIESNAFRFGRRIDTHYENNRMFRDLFPETLPDEKCIWSEKSKQQKRTAKGIGEGTFDFLGVGGAVQSRHYDRIIQDDLVGRDAKNSESVMADTIEYHQLLRGVFDTLPGETVMGDEVVVGNRWCYYDLNGWIRENQGKRKTPWRIVTHSAEGGCCDLHPPQTPIYLTWEVLNEIKSTWRWEDYAHQYLNLAVLPGECPFEAAWLRYYELYESKDGRAMIRHFTLEGQTVGDIPVGLLTRIMVCDPNHAEAKGRAHHGLLVLGADGETNRKYVLDTWAQSTSYDELVRIMYKFAKRWRLPNVDIEKIAAQSLLRYPIAMRSKVEDYKLNVREIQASRAANAKDDGIRAMEPDFRNGLVWCRSDQTQFIEEYRAYPASRTIDLLDCLRLANQVLGPVRFKDVVSAVSRYNEKQKTSLGAR